MPATSSDETPARKLSLWRDDQNLPHNDTVIQAIFEQLFGADPALEDWRRELEEALDRAQEAKVERRRRREISRGASPVKDASNAHSVPRPTPYFIERNRDMDALAGTTNTATPTPLVQDDRGIGKRELTESVARHSEIAVHALLNRTAKLPYPSYYQFWQILDFHLWAGTRPDGMIKKWSKAEFIDRVFLGSFIDSFMKSRVVGYWSTGRYLPDRPDFERISEVIFGTADFYDLWRDDFARAFETESAKRSRFNS